VRLRQWEFLTHPTRDLCFSLSVRSNQYRSRADPELHRQRDQRHRKCGSDLEPVGNRVHRECLRDVHRWDYNAATYNAPATVSAKLTVTIVATSVTDTTKSTSSTVVVNPAPSFTTTSLAGGTVGTAYSATLQPAAAWAHSHGAWRLVLAACGSFLEQRGSDFRHADCCGTTSFTVKLTDQSAAKQGRSQ